ncbi:pyridoxamine 5'-phosphate oxidase family protein [Rathayibacter soli]|uniref:pyridoxamine 5'-phosphate oxidase family protein n=1 Tax=Rathayibacter soli TaxID=3144168 RepID=UPI0027E3E06F|nr:pyridoxamine 5'-phosphate oxidase family protein [Glaciibacter superstes]
MRRVEGPVERLSEEDCWQLLRTATVGRVATSAGGVLDIFPVNYYSDGTSILFRTAPGDKLVELTINENVVFEVDGYTEPIAWSVIAKGTAAVLDRQEDVDRAEKVPLNSWIPTLKSIYVRIVPRSLTGRRFERGPEPEWM